MFCFFIAILIGEHSADNLLREIYDEVSDSLR